MEKIAFKIEFVRLIYREKTKKCFRIRLMAQDGEVEVKAEEMVVPVNQDVVELNRMGAFEMHFVAGEDHLYYLPYNVYFIINTTPSIRRKIPLHLSKIHRHHLDETEKSTPLEQIYTFEEGEIIYKVSIMRADHIVDEAALQEYDQKLSRYRSLKSSEIRDEPEELSLLEIAQKQSELKDINQNLPSNVSKATCQTNLSVEELQQSDLQQTSERGRDSHSQFLDSWNNLNQSIEQHEERYYSTIEQPKPLGKSLTVKFIIMLLIIGLIVLLLDVYNDTSKSARGAKKTSRQGSKQAGKRKIKNQ